MLQDFQCVQWVWCKVWPNAGGWCKEVFKRGDSWLTYDCSQWGVDSDMLVFKTQVWITHYTVWICFSRQSELCRVCGREGDRSVSGRERPAVHEGNSYSWQWVSVISLARRLGFSIDPISLVSVDYTLRPLSPTDPNKKKKEIQIWDCCQLQVPRRHPGS